MIDYEGLKEELRKKEFDVDNFIDPKGGKPIDQKIKPLVIVFNYLDYKTAGSCQGHPNLAEESPWVTLSISSEQESYLESLLKIYNSRNNVKWILDKLAEDFWKIRVESKYTLGEMQEDIPNVAEFIYRGHLLDK